MADGKIICAVDFGTTYSGVAYAYFEEGTDPREVDVELIEDNWPGQGGQSSPKVPTTFKFDKTAPDGFKWGFELDDDPDRICFAKLYLDPEQIQLAQTLATFSTKLGKLPPNKKVTDGVTRFLAALRAVALDRMAADWGQDFVDSNKIQYILTVPAVWSDKAKADTLQCASSAGFGPTESIHLITEPEAAAVYTFHQLPDFSVREDGVFITCDAGGGTVDLTTYKVADTNPVLRLDEVTIGDGGLCGSVYLNRRFEELLRMKIGKQLDAMPKTKSLEALNEIQRVFDEEIKPVFGISDDGDKSYAVPVPPTFKDDENARIQDRKLVVTSVELKDVFDAVIGMIIKLIVGQIEQVDDSPDGLNVSAILLVGGFGSSEYLRKEIESHFEDIIPDLRIIQPANAWSAVTRGAMLRALQGDIVKSRIIRSDYGISMMTPWDPEVHENGPHRRAAEKYKVWCDHEQFFMCGSVMKWYVKRGDEFSNQKLVSFSFYRTVSDLNNLTFTTDLIIRNGVGDPPYFKDPDCRVVATLKANLSQIPKSEFECVSSPTGDFYKISYDIIMDLEAAIHFRLVFKGQILGEVSAEYSQGGARR